MEEKLIVNNGDNIVKDEQKKSDNPGLEHLGNFIRLIEYDINIYVLNTKDLAFNYIMANTDLKIESGGSL